MLTRRKPLSQLASDCLGERPCATLPQEREMKMQRDVEITRLEQMIRRGEEEIAQKEGLRALDIIVGPTLPADSAPLAIGNEQDIARLSEPRQDLSKNELRGDGDG